MASVFYAVDETKTEVKLSAKTYGPAQCIIGDIESVTTMAIGEGRI